jgi:hypothetical protein
VSIHSGCVAHALFMADKFFQVSTYLAGRVNRVLALLDEYVDALRDEADNMGFSGNLDSDA